MRPEPTRRSFLATAAAVGAGGWLEAKSDPIPTPRERPAYRPPHHPVAISSGNGLRATARASELLHQGADTLEAAVSGVTIVENDPADMSVGYGGLPNERGVVELDACVMHGPSRNAGAVAALQGIRNPSRVAQLVMDRTDHVLLVGEGAGEFARAHGFRTENLLTEAARERWLRWKEGLSNDDDWITPEEAKGGREARPTGTITCLALSEKGEISGVTTTSGLAFKLPGRVGDSPLIGAGLYVDGEVGAAGATGRGEAVIIASGSRIVCENMRRGLSPTEAIRDVLLRIVRQTVDPRLRDEHGRPRFDVTLYALRRDGSFAAGSIWKGKRFSVNDARGNRHETGIHLFDRSD